HRSLVDLPIAGVKDVTEGCLDQQPVALGNRVRQRNEADAKRAELDASASFDDVELYRAGQSLFLELAGDESRCERRREQGRAKLFGEIRQSADMILMSVGQHDSGEALLLVFDELQVGKDQLDPRIARVREGQSKVDHDPMA